MVVLGGWLFLMCEVPLYSHLLGCFHLHAAWDCFHIQGYLAHKKTPPPLVPP